MPGRIVVGYDGSPNAAAAVRWAVREARLRTSELEILTAWGESAPDFMVPDEFVPEGLVLDAAMKEMQQQLVADLSHGDLTLRLTTQPGDPAHALVAASKDADMVVVGARGHSALASLLLGSTSLRSVHGAECPVTVVPAEPARVEPGAPVVVGVDGSDASQAALAVAAYEATLRGERLVAVHAVHWERSGHDLLHPTDDQLVGWGREVLETALEPVRARWPSLPVDARVVPGHPTAVLDAQAETADLLVVGTRGHGRLVGLLLGSVSLHVLTHAHRPTTVVAA